MTSQLTKVVDFSQNYLCDFHLWYLLILYSLLLYAYLLSYCLPLPCLFFTVLLLSPLCFPPLLSLFDVNFLSDSFPFIKIAFNHSLFPLFLTFIIYNSFPFLYTSAIPLSLLLTSYSLFLILFCFPLILFPPLCIFFCNCIAFCDASNMYLHLSRCTTPLHLPIRCYM